MAHGLSIHVGLNRVDPGQYNGWSGELSGCINDARDMEKIARSRGFKPQVLVDEDATAEALLNALTEAARTLVPGDTLMLTYSGHGGLIPDASSTDPNRKDTHVWALYNRMLLSQEIAALWPQFQTGVRIIAVADSCHSGSAVREVLFKMLAAMRNAPKADARAAVDSIRAHYPAGDATKFRAIPSEIALGTYRAHQAVYDRLARKTNTQGLDSIHMMARDFVPGASGGSVILMAACQDNQEAADGTANGKFTEQLKNVWADGSFEGGYAKFVAAIAAQMTTQTPNYFPFGHEDQEFASEQPFSLHAPSPDGEVMAPTRLPSVGPGQGGALSDDNQRLLIEAYLRLVDAVGASPSPAKPQSRSLRTVRDAVTHHLVYVHGISVHEADYSKSWWEALHPYTTLFGAGDLAANNEDLGHTRHEVLWSDLVNPREIVLNPQAGTDIMRQRIRDVLEDRHRLQAAQSSHALRDRDLLRRREPPLRTVMEGRDLADWFDKFLSLGYQDFLIYMTNSAMRQQIIDRFTGVVRPLLASGASVDIISHSWGTVVAYEGLRELESSDSLSGRVENFFTAGSALSISPVRSSLRDQNKDGRRPAQVDRWINLDAEGDLVGGTLLDMFAVDVEVLGLNPTDCQRNLWGYGWYELGCAHQSYFLANNDAVNHDIFARYING
jgi:hypothetical protein